MTERSCSQALSDFKKLFERLSYSQDFSTTFNSFLDFALWRLIPNSYEYMKDELIRLDKMYKPDQVQTMMDMFDAWTVACENDGDGFYDALGDLFMDYVSFGRNGQFFTPQPICDMMAELTYGDDLVEGKTVCDPACGSGRMLLAMAKKQRRMKFYAADNDHTCVKMSVLNMLVNSMKGEVAWMNTLSLEHYRSYHINLILHDNHYLPIVTITGKNETNFVQRYQEAIKDMHEPEKIPEVVKEVKEKKSEKRAQPKQTQLLFDF